MPRRSSLTDLRLDDILTCLKPTVYLLNDLHDSFGTPFLPAIANTTLFLITAVQNVKRNKDDCVRLMEQIYGVIHAIINLHLKPETGGTLPPATLKQMGQFTETLHRLHTFITEEQEGSKIKQFFRQSEMTMLLKDCQKGMQQAIEMFKVEAGSTIFTDIAKIQQESEDMHLKLLEMITTLSDGTASDNSSSMYHMANDSEKSSNSFSMLPSNPKIFYGRESELEQVVKVLKQDSARLAILGAGGMGKTSLARAALHHPDVARKYELRVFVPCDSVTSSIGVADLIGSYLGLKPGHDLRKSVVQHFSSTPSSLLVLDNLETSWELQESRSGVEEFLSLLTDIEHLGLLITMRGAERPGKVSWTHPFLAPLQPLPNDAARQTFFDIADDIHDTEDIDRILGLTDNLPLAVDLMAHLVNHEGSSSVLRRWESERTTILSEGYDQRSNLDRSITISLTSPRITGLPGATELLSLISILPDGLSDVQLVQTGLPIHDPLRCKAALLGTALAYKDDKKRLKSLVPIREHVRHFIPPSASLIRPLRRHFSVLLDLYSSRIIADTVDQLALNFRNLQSILQEGLNPDHEDIRETIKCTLSLNLFSRLTGRGRSSLMDPLPAVFSQISDHALEVEYISEEFTSREYHPVEDPEQLMNRAILFLTDMNDPVLEATFYSKLGEYFLGQQNDLTRSMEYFDKALAAANSSVDTKQQCIALNCLAQLKFRMGDPVAGQQHAQEGQHLAKLSGSLFYEAGALCIEALCLNTMGKYKDCITLLQKSRELLGLCGMSGGRLAHDLSNIQAQIHSIKTEYAQARAMHGELLNENSQHGDLHSRAFAHAHIAEIDEAIGAAHSDVLGNLQKATTLFQSTQYILGLVYCKIIMAKLYLRDGDILVAKAEFLECLASMRGKSNELVALCLESLANISQWSAVEFEETSTWAVVFFVHAHKQQQKLELHKAFQILGNIFLDNGDEYTAHSLFKVALEGFTYMDLHRNRADCLIHLGDLAQKQGDVTQAKEFWEAAQPLFKQSLQFSDVEKIRSRLAAVKEDQL